jgi:hypothetical protein
MHRVCRVGSVLFEPGDVCQPRASRLTILDGRGVRAYVERRSAE